jgi:hypothetical protein
VPEITGDYLEVNRLLVRMEIDKLIRSIDRNPVQQVAIGLERHRPIVAKVVMFHATMH